MTYVDLIAENTVDEKIVKALRDKINIASEVLGEELKAGSKLDLLLYQLLVYILFFHLLYNLS